MRLGAISWRLTRLPCCDRPITFAALDDLEWICWWAVLRSRFERARAICLEVEPGPTGQFHDLGRVAKPRRGRCQPMLES
jgi:hypothetical protein